MPCTGRGACRRFNAVAPPQMFFGGYLDFLFVFQYAKKAFYGGFVFYKSCWKIRGLWASLQAYG
jgi:hypothetical protein